MLALVVTTFCDNDEMLSTSSPFLALYEFTFLNSVDELKQLTSSRVDEMVVDESPPHRVIQL